MVDEKNRYGCVLKVSQNNFLIIKSMVLVPNTIDKLSDRLFDTIYQYFSQHIDLFSIELTNKFVKIHLGKIIPKSDTNDLLFHFNLLTQHSHHIIPSTLTIKELTGYQQQISNIEQIEIAKNYVKLNTSFIKIFDFSELKITDFHSKIPRLILEIPNTSIFFSFNKLLDVTYHFSIQLKSPNLNSLENNVSKLISNLKRTPYFSGKLNEIGSKSFRKSPGKNLLGITPNSIFQADFTSFLELIPASLKYATIIPIPPVLPLVKLSQLSSTTDNSNNPVLSTKFQATEDNFNQENNISSKNSLNLTEISSDFPIILKMLENNWQCISFEHLSDEKYLLIVQNEQVILNLEMDKYSRNIVIIEPHNDIINIF